MLPIVTIPAPSLRERSREIDRRFVLLPETQRFIAALIPAMYHYDGIGLAAPQAGNNIRVCVIGKYALHRDERPGDDNQETTDETDLVLVNPSYRRLSKKTTADTEGCLSVPGYYGTVKRHKDILVTALTQQGETIEFEAHNFFARVIQHEVDHLDGILFIDRAKDIYEVEHPTKAERGLTWEVMKKNRQPV
ncbi:MAG: Peptide deformylase [Candidatus Magasanikbacteria bacterium GW2011_GWA2_56_11]|uniref:Peptide deformylase n=1 Tax=Candidatus Magasanikbacteria bacterium GW2011_GWA2_56_11 TaxID=1619044 RepID=A0A0G1YFK0_9BACT|nr:MAG: Peptide deformylase [Candidatus Magasanikbacteria bacterium GW2011_GWA2_56_11]